jgi:hypothetical protein
MLPLKPLHPESSLSQAKLELFGKMSNQALIASLKPGLKDELKVRPDGTIVDGHHRIMILRDRGINVDALPRVIISQEGPAA